MAVPFMYSCQHKTATHSSILVCLNILGSVKFEIDIQGSLASCGSRCRLWKRRTKGGSGQVVRSRTDITKTLLCAQSTLYLPKPSSLSAPEINTPSSLSLRKILATLTKEGENEGPRETLSTGNSKQIHRQESGRRGEGSQGLRYQTHEKSYKLRRTGFGLWLKKTLCKVAQC